MAEAGTENLSTTLPFRVLPNTKESFETLASQGANFSTATLPGLLQAYIQRGDSHYRDPYSHKDEITAAYQNPLLNPFVLKLLQIAATMESAREGCSLALELMDTDPGRAREFIDTARNQSLNASISADILCWNLGKLAQEVVKPEPEKGMDNG